MPTFNLQESLASTLRLQLPRAFLQCSLRHSPDVSGRRLYVGHISRLASPAEQGGTQDSTGSFVEALWDSKDPTAALQLLEAGNVDLSLRFNGKTALHYAALDGHTDLVRKMVAMGAAIDALDEQRGTDGMTPLIWAAMNGHAEVCAALVELGADTSKKEKSGMTAAEIAQAYDRNTVVGVLGT